MWKLSLMHLGALIGALVFLALSFTQLLSQETPYGRVTGVLRAEESGKALPSVRVSLMTDGAYRASYATTTDADGQFTFPRVALGSYVVIADTNAHRQPGLQVAVTEGATSEVAVALKPVDPFLRLYQTQRVFTSTEPVSVRCHGFLPSDQLQVRLYRFTSEAAPRAWRGWLPNAFHLGGRNFWETDLDTLREVRLARSIPFSISRRDVEGVFREELALGVLPEGTYLLAVEGDRVRQMGMIAVTDLGLVMKAAGHTALAYAADLTSGEPLAGVAVSVRREGNILDQGVTNQQGIAMLTIPPGTSETIEMVGSKGDSLAVASTYLYTDEGQNHLRVYTYTDRPVYRPGHTVHFKSLMREVDGDAYRVPSPRTVSVRVTDGNDDEVYTKELTTSARGSLHGDFSLADEALPGWYVIHLTSGEETYESGFSVAEYRKPEFEVRVQPARKRYASGESVRFVVNAQYYFGAPVTDARVSYYITRSPSYDDGESASWDADLPAMPEGNPMAFGDGDYGEGEIVAEGEGKTDETGRLSVSVPEEKRQTAGAGPEEVDWTYTLHASVVDEAKRSEEGAGSVLVTQGDLRVIVSPEEYLVSPAQEVGVTIRTLDYDGRPQAGIAGTATLVRAIWTRGQEKSEEEGTVPFTTDARGVAHLAMAPGHDGDYRIQVQARDHQRRRITDVGWLWVMAGDEANFAYPYQDLQVSADKHLYRQGDTAEIIINSRHVHQQALVTVEGGELLEQRVITLASKSTVLKVPVMAAYLPNVTVSVTFVKGKKLYSGGTVLNVSRAQKALEVQVIPAKKSYQPGDIAEFTVRTLTADGKPVQSEVSLGVVDESIYAIAPDDTEHIAAFFYPRQWNAVSTGFSFPEVYLSGDDKAGSTIRTRKFFPDTAFWAPATVTDARGEAHFSFTLPDNLTTWRATCHAATEGTLVGEAASTTVVTKPFLLRLETPRFLTEGDEAEVAVVAHNLTGQPLEAEVGLNVTGARRIGDERMTLRLAPGKSVRSAWRVTPAKAGTVELRGWGQTTSGGKYDDAMALTLPVLPRGRHFTQSWAGTVTTVEETTITPPATLAENSQRVTVRLAPTLASTMLGSLEYLAHYPYGCTEQTMSCFLPDVEIASLLQRTGARNRALEQKLPKMVQSGLLRLYRYQHDDGGWGWWEHDQSDPWMTAYVVFGLRRAQQAGFTVNPTVLERGTAALQGLAGRMGGTPPADQAFLAYQVAETGRRKTAGTVLDRLAASLAAPKPPQMSAWGWATLALAQHAAGRDPMPAMNRAWKMLEEEWKGTTRSEGGGDTYQVTDDAAMVLFASTTIFPDDVRLEPLVRWILAQRRGDHWFSTRDTAFILYGLNRYLGHTGEFHPHARVAVLLNGAPVASYHLTDPFAPEQKLVLPAERLGDGPYIVRIEKAGAGKLYYSIALDGVETGNLATPAGSGELAITRRYHTLRRHNRRAGERPGPSERAFRVGEVVEVTLTVKATRPFDYLMLEDPMPAGCEGRDRGFIESWEWSNWWTNQVVRDEMVGFAIRHLEPNRPRTITYRLNAMTSGEFIALPPRIYDMYNPNAWATGTAHAITIRE